MIKASTTSFDEKLGDEDDVEEEDDIVGRIKTIFVCYLPILVEIFTKRLIDLTMYLIGRGKG